jgi:hypothetical protein
VAEVFVPRDRALADAPGRKRMFQAECQRNVSAPMKRN